MKWLAIFAVVLSIGIVSFALCSLGGRGGEAAAQAAGSTQDGYELVAPLGSLMEVMDDLYAKMPEKVKSGQRRDFKVLRREAFFLAELGNLAARVKERRGDKEWVALATSMKTAGLSMAEAANNRDGEGFGKFYEQAKETCGACHDKFRD